MTREDDRYWYTTRNGCTHRQSRDSLVCIVLYIFLVITTQTIHHAICMHPVRHPLGCRSHPSLSHWFKMPCAFMHSCPTLMDLTHPISAVYTSYKREVKLLPVVCHSSDSVTVFRCILCSSLEFRLGLTRPLACVLYHCEARIQDDYMKAAVLISRSQPISLPIPALYSIPSPGHCLPKHLPSPASNACGFTSILLLLMLATLHTLQ